jgi:hypothetical protein
MLTKVDPYFKPILYSSMIALLGFMVPIPGFAIIGYLIAGAFACYKFKKYQEISEVKVGDATILASATGVLAGCFISLVFAFTADLEKVLEILNEQLKMRSNLSEVELMQSFQSSFLVILSISTIIGVLIFVAFGAYTSLVFLNRAKK